MNRPARLTGALVVGLALALLTGAAVNSAPGPRQELDQAMKLAQRANDTLDVQNLMGRYVQYAMANHWTEVADLFALKTPTVRLSVVAPIEGPEAVRRFFEARRDAARPGAMMQHTLSTPVIEVAGDGKTAKAVWDSPGTETQGGDGPAYWAWIKYGADFIKEDGVWKIWRLKVYPTFRTPYDKSWVETAQGAAAAPPGAPWRYNGKDTPPLEPAPPRPYFTFDPQTAYQ